MVPLDQDLDYVSCCAASKHNLHPKILFCLLLDSDSCNPIKEICSIFLILFIGHSVILHGNIMPFFFLLQSGLHSKTLQDSFHQQRWMSALPIVIAMLVILFIYNFVACLFKARPLRACRSAAQPSGAKILQIFIIIFENYDNYSSSNL